MTSDTPSGVNFLCARAVEAAILAALDDCIAATRVWTESGRRPPGILDRLAAKLRPGLVGDAAYEYVRTAIRQLSADRDREAREKAERAERIAHREQGDGVAVEVMLKQAEAMLTRANRNQKTAAIARGAMTEAGLGRHWIPSHVDHQARLYRMIGINALVEGEPGVVVENEACEMLAIPLEAFLDGRFAEIVLPPTPVL